MNQDDFRRLVQNTPARQQNGETPSRPSATPGGTMLGSRKSSSIPMTPRTVKGGAGVDFRRQLLEQQFGSQQSKKFRSSAAPKGTKLASGFVDRTHQRIDEEEDDRGKRIKALEEQMKLGQLEPETFAQLRDQITGGDIGATHLVKGLDWKLLERVRRGEDVLGSGGDSNAQKEPEPDVDDEFEKLEEKKVAPVTREKTAKKGEMAPPPPVAGAKRTRDAILAELKAQRKAAAEAKAAAQPQLGAHFRKIGEKRETSRIERDDRGREVLITVDADGNVKRKVRKVKVDEEDKSNLPMPDKDAKPLGMEVPELPPAPEEEIDDIFEGVGDAYDPLAGLGDDDDDDDDDSSSDDEQGEVKETSSKSPKPTSESPAPSQSPQPATDPERTSMPPPPPRPSATKTSYFNETPSTKASEPSAPLNPLKDPTILAAIKKAREIDPSRLAGDEGSDSKDKDSVDEETRLKRRAAMLSASDRDFEDMDMGFGSSRFGDAEEAEEGGAKVKLSEWKGAGAGGDEEGEEEEGRAGKKRKRGPKKRKGDKDSAADVLKVMEQRKAAK